MKRSQEELSNERDKNKLSISDVQLAPEDLKVLKSLSQRQRDALGKLLFVFKVTTYGEKEREIAIRLHDALMDYTLSDTGSNKLDSDKTPVEKQKDGLPNYTHPMQGLSLDDLKRRNANA